MKQQLSFGWAIVFCAVLLTGCIQSASPDTSVSVILNPGDRQLFSVTVDPDDDYNSTLASSGYSCYWLLYDTITDSTYKTPDSMSSYTSQEEKEDQAFYQQFFYSEELIPKHSIYFEPNQECAGIYTVTFFQERLFSFPEQRSWKVIVNGIRVLPRRASYYYYSYSNLPTEFTASAYPEDDYTYQWFLDGVAQSSDQTCSYTISQDMVGTHTLSVTATLQGNQTPTYTFSREIEIKSLQDNTSE